MHRHGDHGSKPAHCDKAGENNRSARSQKEVSNSSEPLFAHHCPGKDDQWNRYEKCDERNC